VARQTEKALFFNLTINIFVKEIITFDIAITPSKLIALFLAVNKSSAHPEISSCKGQ